MDTTGSAKTFANAAVTTTSVVTSNVTPDPNYDFVAPLLPQSFLERKGRQCGVCGMKIDYGKVYGFACGNSKCPCGWR